MTNPESQVDDLLAEGPPPRRSSIIDDNPELAAALKYFLDQKASGSVATRHITSTWFYTNKLRERFDGPSVDAARRYVLATLKLDWPTGKPL